MIFGNRLLRPLPALLLAPPKLALKVFNTHGTAVPTQHSDGGDHVALNGFSRQRGDNSFSTFLLSTEGLISTSLKNDQRTNTPDLSPVGHPVDETFGDVLADPALT